MRMSKLIAAAFCATTLWLVAGHDAWAGIYQCVDANGKKLTSDRPIAACFDREQRELRPDGSTKRVVPPTMTSDERNALEAKEREELAKRVNIKDAVRRDRLLAARFPNEAAHNAAREVALNDARRAVQLSETRITSLTTERKPLLDESEFYVGKPLPAKLKQLLDANDAATDAQRSLLQNQQEEIVRINANFDAELERLRRLWSGAAAGPIAVHPVAAPVATPGTTAPAASAPRKTASN
jgi:Domain of unknown function (DUF4124)